MHHFTSTTAVTFRSIQGLTTLLVQQQAALYNLFASLIKDVGFVGPLAHDGVDYLNVADYVVNSCIAAHLSSGQAFVRGLAFWADFIIDKVD